MIRKEPFIFDNNNFYQKEDFQLLKRFPFLKRIWRLDKAATTYQKVRNWEKLLVDFEKKYTKYWSHFIVIQII